MIKNIIFDLGGVLVDWNPKYVYRTIFKTEEEVDWFLQNITTMEWNVEQDGGRSIAAANELLISQYPEHKENILAYYGRWTEMLGGPIQETVDILKQLVDSKKYRMLALTNWSAETFPVAIERYEFLSWFKGIVVSGTEKCKKPEPEIYNILIDRYQVNPTECIFIDDNKDNIKMAEELGIRGIHFKSPQLLHEKLINMEILPKIS